MANLAVFPGQNAPTTVVVQGRTYTCAVGAAPLVVPDFDAFVLRANGWLVYAGDGAGTTAQRPAANPALGIPVPRVGHEYYDSTLGLNVVWNGKSWIKNDGTAV